MGFKLKHEELTRAQYSYVKEMVWATWTSRIGTIHLGPEDCLRDFEEVERRATFFVELFARHRSIQVSYEALLEEREAEMARIVSNYGELASFFASTSYRRFFEA